MFSLFFVVTNGVQRSPYHIPCTDHADCPPKTFPLVMRCIDRHCQYRLLAEDQV
uniref:Nodule-specific cysteine-rich peptide L25 n=1 Tax=Lens culinaris TaxID=3864 RepID=A0A7T8DV97_LENCU|nr:nodule-specific cysteine-rich peptide L25 [Lens culinaris]